MIFLSNKFFTSFSNILDHEIRKQLKIIDILTIKTFSNIKMYIIHNKNMETSHLIYNFITYIGFSYSIELKINLLNYSKCVVELFIEFHSITI